MFLISPITSLRRLSLTKGKKVNVSMIGALTENGLKN